MLRQAGIVAFFALVIYCGVYLYFFLGHHLHYFNHKPGKCRHVKGHNFGAEDFKATSSGQAFITSGVFPPDAPPAYMKFIEDNGMKKGRIFLYDFNEPNQGAIELKFTSGSSSFNQSNFHPHGIDVLEDKVKGEHLLYVVSHPDKVEDTVEKFRFIPASKSLQHVKTFRHKLFQALNDVAVISEDTFYATNYCYMRTSLGMAIEHIVPLYLGSLVFVKGDDANQVLSGLNGPNGVAISSDKRFVYICEFHERAISVWSRKVDAVLERLQTVPVHTSADNPHLSTSDTELYVGTHPIFHRFMAHMLNPSERSPSSVLRLPLKDGQIVEEKIEEIYYDDGQFQSGSTTATVYKGKLLVSSLLDKIVVCDANNY